MYRSIILILVISLFAFACNDPKPATNNNNINNNTNYCGNGFLDLGETCDGTLFTSGLSCTTAESTKYISGTLGCADNCTDLVLVACTLNPEWNQYVPPENSLIYVNTGESLYFIDPSSGTELVKIGDFAGVCDWDLPEFSGFWDIAVDGEGEILGIAKEGLYTIDKDTADCTKITDFPVGSPYFYSLSWVNGVDTENVAKEVLIGASSDLGEWVEIDLSAEFINELFNTLGYYDQPDPNSSNNIKECDWVSSGDIVSIQVGHGVYKTYATLKCGEWNNNYGEVGCDSDWLAEIRPDNGDAITLIGKTGFVSIFGLGYYGNQVYGFTGDGEYITIDITTGLGTLVSHDPSMTFWGAGTTTKPFIVE
jgi:hypothetical protein